MKKYFLIGILMAIVPNICFGASARFTQLAREKERKMAELEKCMGSTKGLKIAGISTLGLSAVGVAANVVEAKKIKDYDSSIESTQQQIEKTKTEIDKKTDELQKKSLAGQTNDESTDNYDENDDENIVGVAFLHNGTCRVYTENHKWNDVDEKQCSEKLSKGSWLVTKDGESITGDSMCASNGMNVPYVGSPVGVGEYCWCKIIFGSGAYDNWILSTDAIKGIPYICENYCAQNCASAALNGTLTQNQVKSEDEEKDKNTTPKTEEDKSGSGSGNSNSENVVSTSAPSGAPKVTDSQKMLQNVIAQDIAAIKNTPGELGDKIYIHGYTISNIYHLSLHDNLYNAIEEFKNRCYDNAGDPNNAYSVIVGIDEDALGDDSDEKYTENTVLQNLEQHIVSRCECNDYDWKKQGNKCVKK